MNTQINEIAYAVDADFRKRGLDKTAYVYEWEEQFARRIIEECISICESAVGNADYNTGRMHCASDIKNTLELCDE